jgi:serine/threonine protein kinase
MRKRKYCYKQALLNSCLVRLKQPTCHLSRISCRRRHRTLFGYLRSIYEAWMDYPEREGKMIGGQYRIHRFLGKGSYGLTYLCRHVQSGEEIVVKQAKPSKGKLGRELLSREIDILGQLNHPSIPRCLASFEYRKRLYMVVEYVQGETAEDLIFERGSVFSESEALYTVRRLMDIVRFVHEKGYVHLDIRIPNVMFEGEQIHLIDFGLASRLGEPVRAEFGSGEEVMLRRTADVSTDLYAIGDFLLFMLYSAYDPGNSGQEEISGWEEELRVSMPTKLMIRKLLQIDPPYANAEAVIRELDEALNAITKKAAVAASI